MPKPTVQTATTVAPPRIGAFDMFRILWLALCGSSVKGANITYHGFAIGEDSMIDTRVQLKTSAAAKFEATCLAQPDGGTAMRQTDAEVRAETNWV